MTQRYSELPLQLCPGLGIEAVWHSVAERTGRYRVLPDGRCDLILRYQLGPNGLDAICPVLSGTSSRFYDIDLEPGTGFIGARFKPGHAARFLGVSPLLIGPAGKIGAAALALCPRLGPLIAAVDTPQALLTRLNTFLHMTGQDQPPPDPTIRAVAGAFHTSAGRLSVAELAAVHGLSLRHLTRKWRWLTGFGPKTYAMILQFQRALRLVELHGLSPSDAAFEAGYADQAHMTRAFRQFAGFTPARRQEVTLVTIGP
ncbi:MAG: helix-turn-helix domain-containing protein [Paracoccaceae bacterium]